MAMFRWRKRANPRDGLLELGLSEADCAALRTWMAQSAPETVDGVWQFVGRDPDSGSDPPSGSVLPRTNLLGALLTTAKVEIENENERDTGNAIRRLWRRYWTEACIVLVLLAGIAGVARVMGAIDSRRHAGLTPQLVAIQDLMPGRDIERSQFSVAYLPGGQASSEPSRVLGRRPSTLV
jgi:hypothetical protein